MNARFHESLEVLILAPTGRDAALIASTLSAEEYACRVIKGVGEIREALLDGMGAAIIAEEALSVALVRSLSEELERQPNWSDVPLVVLSSGGSRNRRPLGSLRELGNVTVLDRPVQVRTLVSAVEAALRARRRQFAARQEILQRDQFLAMLGHELRNPLGAIMFASDLLTRNGQNTQGSERHVAIIHRQARHLARLVDDLLEVSRVTAGKVVLDRRAVDLAEALRRTLAMLEERVRQQKLELVLTLGEPSLIIDADPVRLEQVFGNLITNAIKYTPMGGRIEVRLERLESSARVVVRDNGIGIDVETLPRVFELFAQAKTAIARTQGGMGIGLTLVRHLVELHGGSVRAHSEGIGKGSEFVVTLPLPEEPLLQAPPSAPPGPQVRKLSLVVVEDNPDLSALLKDVLEEAGHEVSVASDGKTGAALITRIKPHCAFVDIGLPGLDGYEVARQVREKLGDGTRLVALTGYGQFEDKVRALDAGFDDHMKKPVDIQALEKILRNVATSLV